MSTVGFLRTPRYVVIEDAEDRILIRDLGPWDKYPSVTNDAEAVVEELAGQLRGRRLEYIDSEGRCDQLLVRHGKFAGFAPAGSRPCCKTCRAPLKVPAGLSTLYCPECDPEHLL